MHENLPEPLRSALQDSTHRWLFPDSATQLFLQLDPLSCREMATPEHRPRLMPLPPECRYALHRPLATVRRQPRAGYERTHLQLLVLVRRSADDALSGDINAILETLAVLPAPRQLLVLAGGADDVAHARRLAIACKRRLGQPSEWLGGNAKTDPDVLFAALGKADAVLSLGSDLFVDALAAGLPTRVARPSFPDLSALNECFDAAWNDGDTRPLPEGPTVSAQQACFERALTSLPGCVVGNESQMLASVLGVALPEAPLGHTQALLDSTAFPVCLRLAQKRRRGARIDSARRKIKKFGHSPRRFVQDSALRKRFSASD